MEASFDTCGQLWISANRNWVNSANCITLSAAHSNFSESSFRASGTSALKSMLHCWKPEKELRFASAYISWCTVLKWGIGGYYENMHDNENIFKSWVHTDDLERSWAMKIFPPMQFLSHLSCFMARNLPEDTNAFLLAQEPVGEVGKIILHIYLQIIAYYPRFENANTSSVTLF